MTLLWILSWWNLIFLAPFAVALVYLFACTLSGVGMGDSEVAAHGDLDADADADLHGDVDGHDVDGHDVAAHGDADGHDAEDAHAHESEAATSANALALNWLGVGRVPLSLIVVVLLLVWGGAGFVANAIVRPRSDWAAAEISIPAAMLVSLFVTRSMVLFLGRVVPLNQPSALRRGELVGTIGQALYGIDEKFGLVAVRDARGDLQQLPCRVATGVEPIPRGASVKLVAYRAGERVFFVRRTD